MAIDRRAHRPDRVVIVLASVVLVGSVWGSYRSFTPSPVDPTSPVVGDVRALVGEVRRRPAEQPIWFRTELGDTLREGDALYAQPGANVVVFLKDGTRLSVAERSLIVLDTKGSENEPLLRVKLGRLAARAEEPLGVGVGAVVAQLGAGAEAEVVASDASQRVAASGGSVDVGGQAIQEGQVLTVTGGVNKVEEHAVTLTAPAPNSVSFASERGTQVSFSWEGAPDGRLELATDSSFEQVVHTVIGTAGAAKISLTRGTYYWRVCDPVSHAAVSRDRSLLVVLDEPAYLVKPVDDAILYLPPGHSTHFVWTPLASAKDYVWELASDRDFETIVKSQRLTRPQFRVNGGDFPEGAYFWRVRALREHGHPPVSSIRTFRLIVRPLLRAPRLLKHGEDDATDGGRP